MTGQLTPTITWHYWDGDSWEDITEHVMDDSCSGSYGMGSNAYTDRMASNGEMSMSLKNTGGIFDPDDADCLTGWAKNALVKLVVSYDGYEAVKFYGRVSDIQLSDISTNYHVANVTVLDWLDFAYRYTINQQSIETYKRAYQVVDTIVDATGQTPLATSYAEGAYQFEAAFDSMTVKTKAATELNKVVLSEGGYFYNRHDRVNGETLVFEDANYRNGLRTTARVPKLAADCGDLLKAGSATDHILMAGSATDKIILAETDEAHMNGVGITYERTHGDNILNKVSITAYPKRTDSTEQTLYSLGEVMKIASGETKTINVKYQNVDTKESCNAITSLMVQPVATTDYTMNTKKDGTGTDLTSDLTVTVNYYTAEAEITLVNNSAYTGKITKLILRGYGVYQDSSVKATMEDTTSQTAYSEYEMNIEQQYQRDTTAGELWAGRIVAREATPRTKLNRVSFVANKSSQQMLAFLAIDIGDMVKITESGLNIDGYYYVNGVEFSITEGNIIAYSWTLTEAQDSLTLGTLTDVAVDYTYASNQVVEYHEIQAMENNEERTIICSIYPHVLRDGQQAVIYGGISGLNFENPRYMFYLKYDSGTEMYMGLSNIGWTGDYDIRYSHKTDTNITINNWHRIAVTDNPKSTVLEPAFYKDGAAVALAQSDVTPFEGKTPVGSKGDEDGLLLYIGGYFIIDNGIYQNIWDGLIKQVCIYNRRLSAAELALDAATPGCITDGLVFRGLCAPTAGTAAYYDAALTTSQYLYDDVNGAIGVPHGAPTCREIT